MDEMFLARYFEAAIFHLSFNFKNVAIIKSRRKLTFYFWRDYLIFWIKERDSANFILFIFSNYAYILPLFITNI